LATLQREPAKRSPEEDHLRLLSVFPQLIAQVDIADHKRALAGYLEAKGYVVTPTLNGLSAAKGSSSLSATFDDQSRLTGLNG
jgi:hypothetical protein